MKKHLIIGNAENPHIHKFVSVVTALEEKGKE